MARLIRNCAEVEYLVTGYIAKLSGGTFDLCELMLGKTAISRRLVLAADLARASGIAAVTKHEQIFRGWAEVNKVRNTVAHGHYVGHDNLGRYTFMVQDISVESDKSPSRTALSIKGDDIKFFVRDAAHIVALLRRQELPQSSHETDGQPSLAGHPKARRK